MGGINHQPCSDYDPQAILLSNTLSRAYSKFWSGNGEIEEALSFEIGGMLDQANFALNRAQSDIKESLWLIEATGENLNKLLQLMEEKSFQDFSVLDKMNFSDFRKGLEKAGLFPGYTSSWQLSINNINEGGYRKIFATLEARFDLLLEKTRRFINVLECAQELIAEGKLQKSFNENKFSVFKQAFGSLFCTWNETLCIFYFSSLISLELWYLQHGFGSLIDAS